MTQPSPRHLPLLLVLAAVGAALGLGFGDRWFSRDGANGTRVSAQEQKRAAESRLSPQALVYPQPRILASFVMQNASGGTLSNADLRGSWTLLFFGFTHCPDVCPTALATFKQIQELHGKAPKGAGKPAILLKYWFVSVDPERDTPAVLSGYAKYFSPAIIAATAPLADMESITRDFGVVFLKVPQSGTDYTIDHSMQISLIDPDGNLHAMWRPPHIAPAMLDDITHIASTRSR